MAGWATISALATGGGTLVLAAATTASVRSANRSARLPEQALEEQRSPVLVHSRTDDRTETVAFGGGHRTSVSGGGAAVAKTVAFGGGHRTSVSGGGAAVEVVDDVLYLALTLRNVGAGIAVLQAWNPRDGLLMADMQRPDVGAFRPLRRDQYIAGGDVGVWQAVLRDPTDPIRASLTAAAAERRSFSLDLLYTDHIGGQRTISSFAVLSDDGDRWIAAAGRHWYLDTAGPR